ncbi:hypothetical protein Pmani_033814 [Petrolisthes manimaculis]|uniref:Uncharacterized protein n=1 Tax=Petrolisthes manimaculis TaxID=1843537 RepID=A0AAE1TPR8_9EUCA|nr:hypothetical protein Pmani_033814 [Petrolisthes manimaculis]
MRRKKEERLERGREGAGREMRRKKAEMLGARERGGWLGDEEEKGGEVGSEGAREGGVWLGDEEEKSGDVVGFG